MGAKLLKMITSPQVMLVHLLVYVSLMQVQDTGIVWIIYSCVRVHGSNLVSTYLWCFVFDRSVFNLIHAYQPPLATLHEAFCVNFIVPPLQQLRAVRHEVLWYQLRRLSMCITRCYSHCYLSIGIKVHDAIPFMKSERSLRKLRSYTGYLKPVACVVL